MATEVLERTDDDTPLAGRPTAYKETFNRQARRLALLGATDGDLAEFFQVSEVTINAWKQAHPRFLKSLNSGKMKADALVAERLHKRAVGYSARETKVFVVDKSIETVEVSKHIPADVGAAKLWLTNRRPDLWRDRSNVDITSNGQSISQLAAQAWAYGESLRVQTIEVQDAQALISAPATD